MNPLFSQTLRLIPHPFPGHPHGLPPPAPLRRALHRIHADLQQRLNDHASGRAGRTTALDASVALLRVEPYATFTRARQRETQLKHGTRVKKEALIAGELAPLSILSRSHD